MQLNDGFNVRVYGILVDQGRVLLSEEDHQGTFLRKFPGGGIEKGESPETALKREFIEEANCKIELANHFYVSPNFHRSYFRPMQLIALFWRVNLVKGESPPVGHADFQPLETEGHFYRLVWKDLQQLKVNDLSSPLDREVAEKLLRESVALGRV